MRAYDRPTRWKYRFMRFLTLLCSIFILLATSSAAQAGAKPWIWSWWPSHWHNQDFQPLLEDPKHPHNVQWQSGLYAAQDWHPQNWIKAEGSVRGVMDGFYENDIIKNQDVDGDMPVLIVGDGFMRLSGQEKRRVTDFIDYVFNVFLGCKSAYTETNTRVSKFVTAANCF